MEVALPPTEVDQKQEILAIIEEIDFSNQTLVAELFTVLKAWWSELGESKDLMQLVCDKLAIDPLVYAIYRQCPPLIPMMESLRGGEPVKLLKVKYALSEAAWQWWVALLIVRVLLKCDGVIDHSRLVRWLGHKADSQKVRSALALLNEYGAIQTFKIDGSDPMRPITWHRLVPTI